MKELILETVKRSTPEEIAKLIVDMQNETSELRVKADRYDAIKDKIEYIRGSDDMAWATLDWCVEVWSLSPDTLGEAIDQYLR